MVPALAKSNVAMFTEALQRHSRNTPGGRVDARPSKLGFVSMQLTAHGRIEKLAGAWTPEQTVDVLFAPAERGDFYILCPDDELDRRADKQRIRRAAGNIADNRRPQSRWHRDCGETFKTWVQE